MTVTTPSQDYLAFDAAMKARDPKWYESAPAVIGYMAWCASRDSAPPPAGGERKPAAQQEPVPEGYMLVLVPKESPGGKPDWDECIRQSEVATGLKVDRNTFSIIKREVRRWLAQCHASQPAEEQAGERKPLTEAQIDRHSIAAVDCPPSSTVILVSSLRRLLGITATKGER